MLSEFQKRFGSDDVNTDAAIHHFFAPGRVNLIGEHIDYNGGLVLPMAIGLGISAWVRYRNDNKIIVQSKQAESQLSIDLRQPIWDKQTNNKWRNYPLGVLKYFHDNHIPLFGANILLDSSLPMGSGLSSSAALEVLMAYIFLHKSQHSLLNNGKAIALFCQKVENEFIGVNCGIMDQFAVAMGQKKQAMLLNCDTVEHEYVPIQLPPNYQLLIINTNKERQLADSKYNERKAECGQALSIIRQYKNINHLCEANLNDLKWITDAVIHKRAKHIITENQRVYAAATALKNNDWSYFGQLMNASHDSLQQDYEVSGMALDTVVAAARRHSFCLGSRMTGAGFGGCAIALVTEVNVDDFQDFINQYYTPQTGLVAHVYGTQAQDGVRYIGQL